MFESISKWLSSITKSTTSTAKKWFSATSKAVSTVTSPLSDMTKNMTKHLPFMGDEDIWEKVESRVQIDLFRSEIQKLERWFIASVKKAKIPATKITAIKTALNQMKALLDKEWTYNEVTMWYIEAFRSWNQSLGSKIMTEYTDWTRSAQKRITLTSGQFESIKELLSSFEESIFSKQKTCQNISDSLTVKHKKTFDAKKTRNDRSASNKEKIDTLIESKFDLVTSQKKLWYLILELERLYVKQVKHSNSITKTKIEDLLNTKIPAQKTTSVDMWSHISETEKTLTSNREKTLAEIQTWLDSLLPWYKGNTENTKKRLVWIKKSQTADKKKVDVTIKKQLQLSKKIEASLKSPYTGHEVTKKTIDDEAHHWDIIQETIYTSLSNEYTSYALSNKDSSITTSIYQERINRAYDIILINKELALQTGLINRINKKQLAALEKGKKYLEGVMKKHKAPASDLKKRYTNEIKTTQALVDQYQTTKKDLEQKNEDHKTHITELKKLIKIEQNRQGSLLTWAQSWVYSSMSIYLSTLSKDTSLHLKSLSKKRKQIEWEIKKTNLHLKDAQETAKTLQDKKREKAVHILEKKLHDQELLLEHVLHHIEHEEEYILDITEKSKDHSSKASTLEKKSKKSLEKVKTGEKEVKKMKFGKKVG